MIHNIITPIEDVSRIGVNYKMTQAPLEILARIWWELNGADHKNRDWKKLLQDGKLHENIISTVLKALRTYSGYYLPALKVREYHNLVPKVLRRSYASQCAGGTVTPTFKANYLALGKSTTLVNELDTVLGAEFIRGTFTHRYAVDVVAYLDKYFDAVEVAGNTFTEAGIYVDGTASPDTGFLLSHVNIDETIDLLQTYSINAQVSFLSA